jgi:hypothetical protein
MSFGRLLVEQDRLAWSPQLQEGLGATHNGQPSDCKKVWARRAGNTGADEGLMTTDGATIRVP